MRKIAAALEKAKFTSKAGISNVSAIKNAPSPEIEREELPEFDETALAGLTVPYREARFDVPSRQEPHELQTKALAEIIFRIVQIEGPIHEDEVVNRVRDLSVVHCLRLRLRRAGIFYALPRPFRPPSSCRVHHPKLPLHKCLIIRPLQNSAKNQRFFLDLFRIKAY